MKKTLSANAMIVAFLVIILGASFILAGGIPSTSINNPYVMTPTPQVVQVQPKNASTSKSLQIGTLPFTTSEPTAQPQPTVFVPEPTFKPAPKPVAGGDSCTPDTPKAADCSCPMNEFDMNVCPADSHQDCINSGGTDISHLGVAGGLGCAYFSPTKQGAAGCTEYCLGKPVIYLYPKTDTEVSVQVHMQGRITESIPHYEENGWQHILAHPSGYFNFEGDSYHELYYETSTSFVRQPKHGIIIPIANTKETLQTLTTELGLLSSEQQELVDYWMPRLEGLHTDYLFIGLVDADEKKRVDDVIISPTPDTKLYYLFYFKPMQYASDFSLQPLSLPPTPPARLGFTAVEWGGTIAAE